LGDDHTNLPEKIAAGADSARPMIQGKRAEAENPHRALDRRRKNRDCERA